MTLEEFKDLINKLDSKEVCDLFTDNKNCEKCLFYYEESEECVKEVFVEGILDEIGK